MCVFMCSLFRSDIPDSHILLRSNIFWCIVFLFPFNAFSRMNETVDSKQEATYIFRYIFSQNQNKFLLFYTCLFA